MILGAFGLFLTMFVHGAPMFAAATIIALVREGWRKS